MTQTIQAKDIDLRYLIDRFSIQLVENDQFFREWQDDFPEITDLDKHLLDNDLYDVFRILKRLSQLVING